MLHLFFKKIGSLVLSLGLLLGAHQTTPQAPTPALGAAPQFTAAKPTFLYGSGISSSATSIKLTSLTTPDGTAITTAQLVGGVGSTFYATIEPATTKKETVSCTAVTQNTDSTAILTGCTRGLQFTYPYTASASLALSHAGGSSVVLSNSPQLYQDIINYVNSSTAAGVNNASTIAKGILQLSSKLQQASSTAIGGGSTDAALGLYTANSTSTYNAGAASGNGLNVVVTKNNNKIDDNFISTSTLYGTAPNGLASTTGVGGFPAYYIGKNVQIFTSTGTSTFTVPSGITRLHVRLVGGGAQGGNAAGGGGGGYAEGFVDLSFGGSPIVGTTSIQVYVGGQAQWSTFGTNGYFMFGNAGATPTGGTANFGTGSANVFGQLAISGGSGGTNPRTGSAASVCGSGGSTPLGFGGTGGKDDGSTAATNGGNYGAGAGSGTSGTCVGGGTGAQGLVEITW